jgi:predicted aspartyl protease
MHFQPQVDGKTIVMVVDRGAYQVSSRQEALGIPIAPALDIKVSSRRTSVSEACRGSLNTKA